MPRTGSLAGAAGPPSWLYEQAVLAIPKKPDHRARPVYGDANLVVTSASAVHLLAMKVRAGRIKDMDDITFPCRALGPALGRGGA